MSNVVLVGYSGHAFVIADILLLSHHQITGYFEKNIKAQNPFFLQYLGSEENTDLVLNYVNQHNSYALGLGDNFLRRKVDESLAQFSWKAISLIHPRAILASDVRLAEGTVVLAGSIINPLVKIERGCIINTGAIIEHECLLNDYVHVAPGAVLAGNVQVGQCTFIGANAIIKQGLKIGQNVIIGAGSVVLKDIADNETWVGNPAKRIK